ncbi:MAG: chemotaxis protein CheW [Candidatus Hodarchaeota archaeon]
MVSSDIETRDNDEIYLIVKMNLMEFAVPITQVDGVGEFNSEFHNDVETGFCLGKYHDQNEIIPILNLKSYLRCPFDSYNRTSQSRILFLRYSEKSIHESDTFNVGFGVDAIVGLYRAVTLEKVRNREQDISKELKCFQINSYVEINSKSYPILDLIKLLDFTLLKRTLEQILPEKI